MTWRLLQDDGVGAAEGLAVDEALARRAGDEDSLPTLRLYTYRPHAVLVGRFQDVEREVHVERCAEAGVELNRRPTGGGTILMGPDQLGVALALPGHALKTARARERMARFSEGVRRGLEALGIEATFRGKNDLEVDGRKVAGLGVHRTTSGGLLFHASLLVALDVALMARLLRTPFVAITAAELETVARRTVTVRELAGDGVTPDDVRACVARGFAESFAQALEPGVLNAAERADADALLGDKYGTRDWVFQRTDVPDTAGTASLETRGGRLDVSVSLAGRMIRAVHVRGDFFESENALADLEGRLRWTPSDEDAVAATVSEWAMARATGTVEAAPLTRAVVDAARSARDGPDKPDRAEGTPPYGCFVTPGGQA
jgi:lipoate-protein ligase A